MQLAQSVLPSVVIDEIVPVGNDVTERAAGMAEGDAAVHAARALDFEHFLVGRSVDFPVVLDTLFDGTDLGGLPCVLHESGYFAHDLISVLVAPDWFTPNVYYNGQSALPSRHSRFWHEQP